MTSSTHNLARAFEYIPARPIAKLILIKISDGPGEVRTTILRLCEWTGGTATEVLDGLAELAKARRISYATYTYDDEVAITLLP